MGTTTSFPAPAPAPAGGFDFSDFEANVTLLLERHLVSDVINVVLGYYSFIARDLVSPWLDGN